VAGSNKFSPLRESRKKVGRWKHDSLKKEIYGGERDLERERNRKGTLGKEEKGGH